MRMQLDKANIYLVGGAVRDRLLGRPIKERDWVVVGATPEMMLALGFRKVGKEFPVFLHPETGEEYALARTERKAGKGYYGFTCYASPDVTLEEDLKRRDLTINAMAQTEDGQIIDPYGGLADLQARRLRHVSAAFTEDPLRVLRLARFAARFASLGFTVDPKTMQLLRAMVQQGELRALVAERIWQEWQRALTEDRPEVFFQVLRACGALAELLPELDRLFGVPSAPKWHPEIDTGVHTLLALQAAVKLTANPVIRFAVLLHDVGKALTPIAKWPSHPDHGKLALTAIQALVDRYPIPNDYRALAQLVAQLHLSIHQIDTLSAEQILMVLERIDVFRRPERLEQVLMACMADSKGRLREEPQGYAQYEAWQRSYQACLMIDKKAILEANLQEAEIGQHIRQARLKALAQIIPHN